MIARKFTQLNSLICAVLLLASCGGMKQVSSGYNDPSVHIVKPWTPSDHPHLEVLSKSNYYLPAYKTPYRSPAGMAAKYAALMQVSLGSIKNTQLYAFIDDWMGTPYVLGGSTKLGIDCSALVSLLEQSVYNAFDIPRTTNMLINYVTRKREQDLKEGDLVFFSFNSHSCNHVGVYLQNGYVLHASVSKGVTITRLHSPSLYRYFATGGSVPSGYNNYISANNAE